MEQNVEFRTEAWPRGALPCASVDKLRLDQTLTLHIKKIIITMEQSEATEIYMLCLRLE